MGRPRDRARPRLRGAGPRLPRRDEALDAEHPARHPPRGHPRLRHVVARGAGRQVPDRAAGAPAGRGRLRLGVPLPRSDRRTATRWRSSSRSRARPPTRWRRCARRRPRARAASRSATSSAAWRRANATARSTRTPGPEIGVASTKAFTSQLVALHLLALLPGPGARHARRPTRSRPHLEALTQLPLPHRGGAADASRRSRSSPSAAISAPTSSTSGAAFSTRSRSRAR